MWRRQLPAWSPVTLRSVWAGLTASTRGGRQRESLQARILAEYGAMAVELTQSGTTALALAMLASAPNGRRPRVALPAWGCYDLMTAADTTDAEVLLYDLDPATLAPSAASFSEVLQSEPTAVVVAHWFGLPVALAALIAQVREAGAACIEDAAQGVGGSIAGRPLGSLGDFGILSFGRGKGRTGGGGGALLANNATAAAQLQSVAHRVSPPISGRTGLIALAAQWALARPWLYIIPSSIPMLKLGETHYQPPAPLRGMAEWSAAVLLALWDRSAAACGDRRAVGATWARAVAGLAGLVPFTAPTGTAAGWLRYPVRVPNGAALRGATARQAGIMPSYPMTLAELPLAQGRLANAGPWPGATHLATTVWTLPSHGSVRERDVRAAVRLFADAARGET